MTKLIKNYQFFTFGWFKSLSPALTKMMSIPSQSGTVSLSPNVAVDLSQNVTVMLSQNVTVI